VLSTETDPNSKSKCVDIGINNWYRSPGNDLTNSPLNGLIEDGYRWGKTGAKDKIPSTATVCQSGFYCQKGDMIPCSNGKFCNNRLRKVDGDDCPAGYYCVQNINPDTSVLTGTNFKALIR